MIGNVQSPPPVAEIQQGAVHARYEPEHGAEVSAQPESAARVERADQSDPLSFSDGRPRLMASLAVPADADYLAIARVTAMHVGALLGLTVGRITDVRLAVDEACSLLLRAAGPGALELSFERCLDELRVTVRGPAPSGGPEPDDVGWLMMRALVGDARMETDGDTATVTLIEPLPRPV
jgi:serine/threonine-protein kinase RsbW